jgi:hypothetical protein
MTDVVLYIKDLPKRFGFDIHRAGTVFFHNSKDSHVADTPEISQFPGSS